MKVKLCCFTCLICEDNETKDETESKALIEEDAGLLSPKEAVQTQPSRQFSSSTVASTSDYSFDRSESFSGKDQISKTVGVLKRYNVVSKRYMDKKEFKRQLTSEPILSIKIAVKLMPRSDLIKLFVVECTNVMAVLKIKDFSEVGGSSDSESAPVMQIRSKLIPVEIRGHTRKYEINDSITGSMKFRNECLHSLNIDEFFKCSIRFRIYYVLKHHRDKLLGEYTLDVSKISIPVETGTTNIIMETYDPLDDTEASPPEVIPINQHLFSVDSQSSIDKGAGGRRISRQSAIQSQDSVNALAVKQPKLEFESVDETEDPETEDDKDGKNRKFSKAFKSIRHGATHILKDSKEKLSSSRSTSQETDASTSRDLSAIEKLRKVVHERTDNVEKLEDNTALMENSAESFSDIAGKLREKYQHSSTEK